MRGSVALSRSCTVSWSKVLLFGNLLCLCGIGSYWLTGNPLEAGVRGLQPGTVPLGERVTERRYSVRSGAVLASSLANKGSPSHSGSSPGSREEMECDGGDASCKETSSTATDKHKEEKNPYGDSSDHIVGTTSSRSTTLPYSLNSLKERGEFQKEVMKQFCSLHPPVRNDTPTQEEEDDVFRHLLYDDNKEIIFCYVPKVGCSNWKRMFVVLNGLLPPTESSQRPSEDILRSAYKLVSLKPEEREWRLRKYFKFTMLRNPLERIVSAYRNKAVFNEKTLIVKTNCMVYQVAVPIDYAHRWSFPSRDLVKMLRQFEPDVYQLWRVRLGQVDVHPSFISFLRYLSTTPRTELNEHFRPVLDLCRPCELQYDLYTNFKYLPDDAMHVMDLFGIPHHYYLNREGHPHLQTSQLVHSYFKNITSLNSTSSGSHDGESGLSTLQALFSLWSDELSLYYSLFPEEKDCHKQYTEERVEQKSHHADTDNTYSHL